MAFAVIIMMFLEALPGSALGCVCAPCSRPAAATEKHPAHATFYCCATVVVDEVEARCSRQTDEVQTLSMMPEVSTVYHCSAVMNCACHDVVSSRALLLSLVQVDLPIDHGRLFEAHIGPDWIDTPEPQIFDLVLGDNSQALLRRFCRRQV